MDSRLVSALAEYPVIASATGIASAARFVESDAPIGMIAGIGVRDLERVCRAVVDRRKIAFVNLDSSPGLGHDAGALEFLLDIGSPGVCSTRAAVVERAGTTDMLTMQKVFVTDRTTLQRSLDAVARSSPDLVQLMPAIVISQMTAADRKAMTPYVAAGFVTDRAACARSLELGAMGVCSSDPKLWSVRRNSLDA